jgi:hypothetical protein
LGTGSEGRTVGRRHQTLGWADLYYNPDIRVQIFFSIGFVYIKRRRIKRIFQTYEHTFVIKCTRKMLRNPYPLPVQYRMSFSDLNCVYDISYDHSKAESIPNSLFFFSRSAFNCRSDTNPGGLKSDIMKEKTQPIDGLLDIKSTKSNVIGIKMV